MARYSPASRVNSENKNSPPGNGSNSGDSLYYEVFIDGVSQESRVSFVRGIDYYFKRTIGTPVRIVELEDPFEYQRKLDREGHLLNIVKGTKHDHHLVVSSYDPRISPDSLKGAIMRFAPAGARVHTTEY